MADEVVTPSLLQGTEGIATADAPTDFREYAKWRQTGELPDTKEETPPAAAAEKPPAKTEPDSETGDSQETGDEKEEGDDDEGAPAGKSRGGSRQRRIDKLTREIEALKRQIAEPSSVKPQDKPSQPAQPATAAKPKLEDFQTLEAYQEALTDWKLDERDRLQKEQQARTDTENALRQEQTEWTKKERAARKAHSDYDDLMETVQIPAGPGVLAARQAMLEDPNGAELLYHLAKHPKELERIAALPPASAVMAIGRLSAAFEAPATENGKPKLSGAPKPPPPSSRPGKIASDDPNDPEVQKDFKRWAKAREAQLKGR